MLAPLLLLLLLACVGVAGAQSDERAASASAGVHVLQRLANGRSASAGASPSSPWARIGYMCALACGQAFGGRLAQLGPHTGTAGSGSGVDVMRVAGHVDAIKAVCAAYAEYGLCARECGESGAAHYEQQRRQLDSLAFLCERHLDEFIASAPCMVAADASGDCAERCAPLRTAAAESTHRAQAALAHRAHDYPKHAVAMLGDMCSVSLCASACVSPLVAASCGSDAPAELMRRLVGRSLAPAMHTLEQGAMRVPASCAALAADYADSGDSGPPLTHNALEVASGEAAEHNPRHMLDVLELADRDHSANDIAFAPLRSAALLTQFVDSRLCSLFIAVALLGLF